MWNNLILLRSYGNVKTENHFIFRKQKSFEHNKTGRVFGRPAGFAVPYLIVFIRFVVNCIYEIRC